MPFKHLLTSGYSTGTITIAPAVKHSLLKLDWSDANDDIEMAFTGEENGQLIKMAFVPELNISVNEHIKLTYMITACSHGLGAFVTVMRYVRKHNLERHFKFTAL